MNAPEGRAREIEWRGRSHRLREAALLALRPRRAGAAMESGRPGQPGWQRTSHSSSLPARPGTSVPRRVNSSSHDRSRSWYSDSRHSSNGEQPRSPGSPSDILQFTGGWSRVGRQRDMQWSSGHGLRATVFGPAAWDDGRCPARTDTPQGVHAPKGQCGCRIETLPATRRTP